MAQVVVVQEKEYDQERLRERLQDVLCNKLEVFSRLKGDEKILLKPNLLMGIAPDEAITTHPAVVEAAGRVFKERGFDVYIADNPGGFAELKNVDNVYEACGMSEVARRCGFTLLYPERVVLKENIPFSWWIDGFTIVNLAKLKTHQITTLTLATKNLYGCISGLYKSMIHKYNTRPQDLARFILKLYKLVTPLVNIVDGIVALEGEGPARAGTLRQCNLLAIGDDCLATDYVVNQILNASLASNPLLHLAVEEKILDRKNITVYPPTLPRIRRFKFPHVYPLAKVPKFFIPFLKVLLNVRPHIELDKCTGCGVCDEACPPDAISMVGVSLARTSSSGGSSPSKQERAVIDYRRCILCMCCYEVCKFQAVTLKKSFAVRAWDWIQKRIGQ